LIYVAHALWFVLFFCFSEKKKKKKR
jgi:hypothetical protein